MTKYFLMYREAAHTAWQHYKMDGCIKVLRANTDADSEVLNALQPPVWAQFVRVVAVDCHCRPAMRLEVMMAGPCRVSLVRQCGPSCSSFCRRFLLRPVVGLRTTAAEHAVATPFSGDVRHVRPARRRG